MVRHIVIWGFLRQVELTKSIITTKFHRRLKLMWESLLCGQFKVVATNSFCIPLLCNGFGLVEWTKAEISQFDVFIRKALAAANSHHPLKSSH